MDFPYLISEDLRNICEKVSLGAQLYGGGDLLRAMDIHIPIQMGSHGPIHGVSQRSDSELTPCWGRTTACGDAMPSKLGNLRVFVHVQFTRQWVELQSKSLSENVYSKGYFSEFLYLNYFIVCVVLF